MEFKSFKVEACMINNEKCSDPFSHFSPSNYDLQLRWKTKREKGKKRENKKYLYILKWIWSVCFRKKKSPIHHFPIILDGAMRPKHFENQPA